MRIFNEQQINTNDWIIKPIDKERGGIEFMLPSAEGKIYLGWEDFYKVDITFVQTKKSFIETCGLGDVNDIIKMLEEQRIKNKNMLLNMLKDAFSGE